MSCSKGPTSLCHNIHTLPTTLGHNRTPAYMPMVSCIVYFCHGNGSHLGVQVLIGLIDFGLLDGCHYQCNPSTQVTYGQFEQTVNTLNPTLLGAGLNLLMSAFSVAARIFRRSLPYSGPMFLQPMQFQGQIQGVWTRPSFLISGSLCTMAKALNIWLDLKIGTPSGPS